MGLNAVCPPDVVRTLTALRLASGLQVASSANVIRYDWDVDGAVTIQDAVAVLQACPDLSDRRILYVAPDGDDANAGTRSKPWRTLKHSMMQLRPGDTLVVRQGIYVEAVRPDPFLQWNVEKEAFERKTPSLTVPQGEPNARIVMRAYPGERPEIHGLFWPYAPSYWTFDGINVTWPTQEENAVIMEGDPTTYADDNPLRNARDDDHMVKISGGTDWVYQNAEIQGAQSFAGMLVAYHPVKDDLGAEIGQICPSDWVVRGNVIHDTMGVHVILDPNNGKNEDHCLYVNTGLAAGPGLIERNILYNASNGMGIKLGPPKETGGSANVTVCYNTIYNTGQSIMIAEGSHHNTIARNLLVATGTHTGGNLYTCIRGYRLNGTGNTADNNAGFDADQMILNDAGYIGVQDNGGNVFPINPQFDSIAPDGFHPQNPEAQKFGRYAP